MSVQNSPAAAATLNKINEKVMFRKSIPFTICIIEINDK